MTSPLTPARRPSTDPAEPLLIAGGTVRPLHARGAAADAVAVIGDRILAVGTLHECREALAATSARPIREIDLAGATVLPGFVDPHCHPLMYGQTLGWVDCGPERAQDIDGVVALLQAEAARTPAGMPVRGFGYEHRNLAEGRHPTRHDLDRVATDREVYLMNASGHGGAVNTFALHQYGITAATADPVGGRIERDPDGHPSGLLWDAACDWITGPDGVKVGNHGPNFHVPESADVLAEHLLRAQGRFFSAGVTTIGDAQVSQREMTNYLNLDSRRLLTLRVHMYVLSSLLDEVLALGISRPFGGPSLRLNGIKLYADGTLGGWTAWFPDGYASDPCNHGQLYHDPDEYRQLLTAAHAAGLQTGTHAQSPASIEMVLDAIASAGAQHPRDDARHRIEHCGLPTGQQIQKMAALGVLPVTQSQHHYRWGDGVLTAVGEETGQRFNPLGAFRSAGIQPVLSSDAPVAEPNPLEAVMAAVTRRTCHGTVLGPTELRLDLEDALRAHTWGGAMALGREDEIGTLEPGKYADFCVLDSDPWSIDVDKLPAIRTLSTWIGGAQVHQAD